MTEGKQSTMSHVQNKEFSFACNDSLCEESGVSGRNDQLSSIQSTGNRCNEFVGEVITLFDQPSPQKPIKKPKPHITPLKQLRREKTLLKTPRKSSPIRRLSPVARPMMLFSARNRKQEEHHSPFKKLTPKRELRQTASIRELLIRTAATPTKKRLESPIKRFSKSPQQLALRRKPTP